MYFLVSWPMGKWLGLFVGEMWGKKLYSFRAVSKMNATKFWGGFSKCLRQSLGVALCEASKCSY